MSGKTASGLSPRALKRQAKPATALAIPDPFKTPVPFGWAQEFALPALEQADQTLVDESEAKLAGLVALIEKAGGDPLEFEKALRIVDKRKAELNPKKQGSRGDLSGAPEKSHAEVVALSAKHQILDAWSWLWPDHIAPAKKWKAVRRATCLRVIAERQPVLRNLPDGDAEGEGWRLLAGSLEGRLPELESHSVDLIVTDPPYPKESLPLWSSLGEWSAKLLRPRGLLLAYTGQIYLPEVLERLADHLTYGWTFALMLPGSGARVMGRHIVQAWKPVVAFSTGTWPSGEWADDVLYSPERQKDHLAWQQNAVPAQRLVERYSAPDALILDPFAGTGTFGVAALQARRKFVGVEPDADRFRTAVERLESIA